MGWERSEGQSRGGGQDQAEEILRVLRALSGVCVSPLTPRSHHPPWPGTAAMPVPTMSHPSWKKGKYPPGTWMGMSLPVCWSRALFPVTFKVLHKVPVPSPPPSPCFPYMVSQSMVNCADLHMAGR